jgi:uncharacterized membrane protein YoaK (UPF0700 family)
MQVNLHTPESIYAPRHLPSWFLLAAAAGLVNGFAFLTSQQFVSHVTGTVTRMGLEWPHVELAAEYTAVLLCFIAGAVTAVVMIQTRARRRAGRARWATPLVSVALILIAVGVTGAVGELGPYGTRVASDPPPLPLMVVLSFAMGLQNAAVASTTGLAVRTTHLTGPATDLGIHLGTALLSDGAERRMALHGAAMRGGKVIAFMAGAALSLPVTAAFGYLVLLAAALFILGAAGLSFAPDWSPSDYPFQAADPAQPVGPVAHAPPGEE